MTPSGTGTPISRGLVAATSSTILGVGFAVQSSFPDSPIAVALFLMAIMVSNFAVHRGLTLVIATCASLIVLLPYQSQVIAAVQHLNVHILPKNLGIALLTIWTSSALLVWDPRRRTVTVDGLNEALATALTGMVVISKKGVVKTSNETFRKMLGFSEDVLDDAHLKEVGCANLWDNISSRRAELENGEAIRIGSRLTTQSERELFASGYVRTLTNSSGDSTDYVVQLLDLSEAMSRERALTNAKNRFEKLFENSNDLILIVDPEGQISSANPKVHELFGQGEDELLGQDVVPLVQADEIFMLEEVLERCAQSPGEPRRVSQLKLNTEPETVIDAQFVGLFDMPGIEGTVITGREVTELLSSLNRLRSSEARFSRIFHSSPDAIVIIRNSDGTITDFNEGFTKLLGYTREQAIGTQNLLPKLWVDAAERDQIMETLREQRSCTQQCVRMLAANNDEVFVELSVRYIEIDNELCVMAIGRDISQQVAAQAELHDSQTKFSRVFTHSPDGIVILRRRDGAVLDINDAFLHASGYRKNELLDKRISELPIFADDQDTRHALNLIARVSGYTNLEVTFRTKQGTEIPSLVSATEMELGSESCILCIARDVREQRTTEAKLRASEERFRGTFENAPIGIMLADPEGRIFQANLYAAQLLAYKRDKLEGTHLSRLVPAEDRIYLKDSLDKLMHGNEHTSTSERRMICQDATEIWTNCHVVAQRSENDDSSYFIIQIADITEMKNSQKRMEKLAFYDTLTNLANRTLFAERLAHAIDHAQRRSSSAALLYLDLDQFKRVNDTLGHEAGDQLLREVALRLKDCVRKEDTVGRSGGDEFTILLYDIKTPNHAGMVAEKILSRLREPIDLSGHPLVVTTSIGITIIPGDGTVPNELMKNADLAMYRAKERGRNNFQFYSEEMNTNATNRLRMEYEIRSALENNEFELYYQPKVRLSDQRITGMECLIRWDHPTRGLIGPYEFIEVAEETGSIVDIGSWVIKAACEAGRILSEVHGTPIYTAVNISPRQFRDPNLIQTIQRCLRQTKLNPNFLELEITETMLMKDIDVALMTLNRLADLGLRFAIDDFGTGYSSLNYLKKFPIDTVKVDRSFIMDIPQNQDDMEISAAVIAMAHRLNMDVVAEGVETEEQLAFLQSQHCDYGQGYYFAKPIPFDEMRELVAQSRATKTA